MNALHEIAKWAASLPPWQSDAARRIYSQEILSTDDEDQIWKMLLAANGIADAEPITPVLFPKVMTAPSSNPRRIILKEIHSLENVNALVPGQSLKFAVNGLTVIYGENGAGKSGYARVFKHTCQAREKGEPILPNIASTAKAKAKPAATLEVLVDDEDRAFRWEAGADPSEVLSEIAVFDSHCARVFIDQANDVVYLPYGLDIFSRLANLCNSLKAKVANELKGIATSFEQGKEYSESTQSGRIIRILSANSDVSALERLAALSEEEGKKLDELRSVVASIQADAPGKKASQLRRTKNRLTQLRVSITEIATHLSSQSLTSLAVLSANASNRKEAAKLASTEAFGNEPVSATGLEPWRILFEAARKFSTEAAYPAEDFPVTREGAFCLLCQQPLSEEAKRRLEKFEQFIRNDAAQQSDEASASLQKALKNVAELKLSHLDDDGTLLEEVHTYDEELSAQVTGFFQQAKALKKEIGSAIRTFEELSSQFDIQFSTETFDIIISGLEDTAVQYDSVENPEEFKKLKAELAELEDRARLRTQLLSIRNFIKEKQRETSLKKCEKALDTTSITRQSSELMENIVTEQLKTELNREIKALGVSSTPVQIKRIGQKGKTKYQLSVPEASKPSSVLSEGEQRIIAISSFMAELKASGSKAPIIIDDPVSSLDHRFREKVAARLVSECNTRQVVVFTHDIVLLLALEREAAEQSIPLKIQTVSKSANGPGECIQTPSRPWHACNTTDRIGILKDELNGFTKLQNANPAQYAIRVASFYGKLRETWERLIEEKLLNDVIQRFRPGIETMRLKNVTIEKTDYSVIEIGMSKCSTWLSGHDSAAAIAAPVPSPSELSNDLNSLEEFLKTLKKRLDKTNNSIAPPIATISTVRAVTVTKL